jgi:hypothetical protein
VYGGCEVSATDTLKVFLANLTTSAVNDGPNDWRYLWLDLT